MAGRCLKAKRIVVVGVVPSFAFQRAKYFVLELHRSMPRRFPAPEIHSMLEMEWCQKLEQWRRLFGLEFWRLRRPVAIFIDDIFVGSDLDLMKITSLENIYTEFIPPRNAISMKKKLRQDYLAHLRDAKKIYCYLDICVDDSYIGTLVFQLFSQILPKTCANFTSLCLGTRGNLLSYKNSRIHRIVKNGWLQGGDIQYKTGGGGYSIYCDSLEDECYGVSHDRRGVLSMANDGKHSNGSQFFITLKASTWMDTYYVAFGHLVEGTNVLNILETIDTFYEKPLKKIEIKNCGKLNLRDARDIKAVCEKHRRDTKVENRSKKIEAIADQLIKLIMDEMIKSLVLKERISDIVHEADIPSIMNLELYFHGLYSLSEEVLEACAKYVRTLKRENLRSLRPSATEIVEVITYDLLTAIMTKMMDLDHVREAAGQPIYQKLLEGIDMKLEMAEKAHVKQFVDQLVKTSETIVDFISRKLNVMRKSKKKSRIFQDQMDAWVQSFVMQETFANDSFHITNKPLHNVDSIYTKKKQLAKYPYKWQEKEESLKKKEYHSLKPQKAAFSKNKIEKRQAICETSSNIPKKNAENKMNVSDFFSSCRYQLKNPERNRGEKASILDLIETSRFRLKFLRHQEKRLRSKTRLCLEKRINKWMEDVKYTPETEWIRQTVFSNKDICISHTEEIMYGAVTVALLEMYFLLEEYMKVPKMKFRTRKIYPKNSSSSEENLLVESQCTSESISKKMESCTDWFKARDVYSSDRMHRPCLCGDICCDCPFVSDIKERTSVQLTPIPSLDGSVLEVTERSGSGFEEAESMENSSSTQKNNIEELMSQVLGIPSEKIDVVSFKWMQDYIQEKGCSFKSEFVVQVHNWLEDEIFTYDKFLSKHSLVSRASLLSFSMSLASLIKEESNIDSELKDFIFDLWELYFKELFKEALMEYPPEMEETKRVVKTEERVKDEGSEFCFGISQNVDDFDEFCREAEMFDFEGIESRDMANPESVERLPKDFQQIKLAEEETSSAQKKIDYYQIAVQEKVLFGEDEPEKTEKAEAVGFANGKKEKTTKSKRRKSPIFIRERIESEREVRKMPPYVLPFWIKFTTEITKRALGQLSKMSRVPRRLYFASDSLVAFDDKMQEWIEFNRFGPPTTGRRDIKDYIVSHRVSTGNLHDTARSFLRKKIIFELLEKSSRSNSAQMLTEELILDLLESAMKKIEIKGNGEKTESGEGLCSHLVTSIVKRSAEMVEDHSRTKVLTTDTEESEHETREQSLDSMP